MTEISHTNGQNCIAKIRASGGKVYFPETCNIQSETIGENATIHSHVWIGDKVTIGKNVKIQAFAFIPNGVTIGDDVFIGPRVCFTNDKNPPSDVITPTEVSSEVVIGAGAVILCGVKLHKGAKIGAGAVVTKDVMPFKTVVGNPARELPSA